MLSWCLMSLAHSVIFVHGLGSNPDKAWIAPKGLMGNKIQVNWITDFLPFDLRPEILQRVRLFFYNYDSYWMRDALETRLWSLGDKLLSHVSSVARTSVEVCFPFSPYRCIKA